MGFPIIFESESTGPRNRGEFEAVSGAGRTGRESGPYARWIATADPGPSWKLASDHPFSVFIFEVVTGFVLFRLFDVWKPGAIGWAERRLGGGLGVMADDVMAGLYAAVCLFGLRASVFEGFYSNPATWLGRLSGVKPIDLGAGIGVGIGVSL